MQFGLRFVRRIALIGVVFLAAAGALAVETVSLLNWNTAGNGSANWSTNAPQVQALGRIVQYLQPDIIALQEIPYTNTWQMANFVRAYCPGYALATNSGTDGYIRSVVLSRFPITRSTRWLDGVSLLPF